jgi:hypothetical protein
MPKDNIDYSKTIIYKITCKDKNINDIYVGHTTNFVKRKCLHKYACTNLDNKLKIYHIIRQNGGWDNWDMTEIAMYNCKNKTEARLKEQQHYEDLNANLNSCPPFQEIKYFICEKCNYKCCKQSEYNKHLLTSKHQNLQNPTSNPISQISNMTYHCICGKKYKHSSTLYTHKKNCVININNKEIQNENVTDQLSDKELIVMLVKQNSELLEVIKNMTYKNSS